ncbi:hypothetical protein [uncultured Flavobacterium sp.]|uniref:hypothetical protein n=1 Tax=uncultured Flavobacterium sp. TaxID=165435 RepID=UPI0030EF7DD0|tara:strand:+ start:94689 stop:96389 length:1701 start_codon:yes stop_codon:yes gene_type:complete
MKKIILFALVSMCSINSWAQTNINSRDVKTFDSSVNESIYLHINNPTILVGESIFYKLYCLNSINHTYSTISKIAYVEIFDTDGTSISKQKLLLKDGVAQGDIFIPTSANSGAYKLIGYTNWMMNFSKSNMFETDITIINPFQSKILIPQFSTTPLVKNEDGLQINLNKKNYNLREEVKLSINTIIKKTNKGNYSLSVRKVNDSTENESISSVKFLSNLKNTKSLNQNVTSLPEVRGEVISGKITSVDANNTIENKTISLSIPGKSFEFKLTNTNKKGEFIFILDELPNKANATLQVVDDARKNYTIEVTNRAINFSKFQFQPIQEVSTELKKIIEKRSIANQIENAYFSIKKDTIKDQPSNKPFYFPLEKTISLDDYTRFSTLKETIIEILPNTFFKEKDGVYTINLRDKLSNGVDSGYTLVLIDGLLIQNVKELFEYNTKNIDKVEYITEKYVYGSKIYNGLINFITKEFDYELKETGDFILKTEIQRPLTTKYYYKQNYSDVSKFERIPDYRYQLLWNPTIDLENEKEISFFTSDIKGKFEISIEGFSADGKPVSSKEYFEVK